MKVLLVQAYLGRKEMPIFPLGLAMLGAVLPHHEVSMYDPNVSDDPYGGLKDALTGLQPDAVGISLRNVDNQQADDFFYYFKTMGPTLEIIKTLSPKAAVVIGGAGFSMFARKIMERLKDIDFGVYLEGEESFPELLDNLEMPEGVAGIFYRKDGQVAFTGPRPLPEFSRLPQPRKDLVDIGKYSFHQEGIGIQTRRGCPLQCCYCTYPTLNGNKIRKRSPESVVDEIEDWTKRGVASFMFADALFSIPLDFSAQICREIINRKLKVTWSAWAEPRLISREFLLLAREAGCTFIAYSPDALSDDSLGVMGKNITRNDVLKSYRLAREIKGIKTGFGFFLSPPRETLMGFLETLWFYLRGNIMLRFANGGGVGIHRIRIEPDTKIYDIALAENVISRETELLPEFDRVKREELFYSSPSLKRYNWIALSILGTFALSRKIFRLIWRRSEK